MLFYEGLDGRAARVVNPAGQASRHLCDAYRKASDAVFHGESLVIEPVVLGTRSPNENPVRIPFSAFERDDDETASTLFTAFERCLGHALTEDTVIMTIPKAVFDRPLSVSAIEEMVVVDAAAIVVEFVPMIADENDWADKYMMRAAVAAVIGHARAAKGAEVDGLYDNIKAIELRRIITAKYPGRSGIVDMLDENPGLMSTLDGIIDAVVSTPALTLPTTVEDVTDAARKAIITHYAGLSTNHNHQAPAAHR